MKSPLPLTRRDFVRATLALPLQLLLAACGLRTTASPETPQPLPTQPSTAPAATHPPATPAAQALSPTPACGDADDVTPPQTAGPFYTPDTPQRTSLIEAGITGTQLTVAGYVLATDCTPIAGALLDFWHADDNGEYDNVGYKLRGHQFANDQGRYSLETIVPGLYPGRTRHIHVKVQAPNQPVLTTQLYFPDEPQNAADGIFQPELLMEVQDMAEGKAATFNFVLEVV